MSEFASIASLARFLPKTAVQLQAQTQRQPARQAERVLLLEKQILSPLRIAIIASGDGPIPPVGWSTVQSMAWDLCHTLTAKGHAPFLVNTRNLTEIVRQCVMGRAEVIYILQDEHVIVSMELRRQLGENARIHYLPQYSYTSHPLFLTHAAFKDYREKVFQLAVKQSSVLTSIMVPSKTIAKVYKNYIEGNTLRIYVIHAGAREDLFRFAATEESASKLNRSIYLANVETRKCQAIYQTKLQRIDYVGPYHNSAFDCTHTNYLGPWTRTQVYQRLTDYGNLVLLANGESDPLVVKEALMAGLGVVLSECVALQFISESIRNTTEIPPFIDIVPMTRLTDFEYIARVIAENRERSVTMREQIRAFAVENVSYGRTVDTFIQIDADVQRLAAIDAKVRALNSHHICDLPIIERLPNQV